MHLPTDPRLLAEKIQHSIRSFAKTIDKIEDEIYLFVLEELTAEKVIGCCGIFSQTNLTHPFYKYKIINQLHRSESLHITHENKFLQLVNDYQSLSEIGLLALLPEFRHHHYGKFLSRVRFLYIAEHRNRFTEKIIAQMRGVVDEEGHSPFWQALGKKFMDISFVKADDLIIKGDERFVAELLPDTPIAIELLPEKARAVIGQTHPQTAPDVTLLQREGFTFENYIDIFEGGPCFELYLKQNPTINHSKRVCIQDIQAQINSEPYMICTVDKEFSACLGELLLVENDHVIMSEQTADILNVKVGDTVRISYEFY